jgi:hypothetical protein
MLLAGLAWTRRAPAVEGSSAPTDRVRLVYALGVDCPTPSALERELDARLGAGWQASPDELARTITVSEELAREDHAVRIEYSDGSGRPMARQVNARTCEEAASMTAVVVAIAIDALAHERETAQSAPVPHASTRTSDVPLRPAVTLPSEPAPQLPSQRRVHEGGGRVGISSGFGTRAAWGAGVEWGLVGRSGFALRASLEARTTGNAPAADGRARFSAFTARGEACIAALRLAVWFSLPLCAGLEAGALSAEGLLSPPTVTAPGSSVVPWVAGLLTPRLRLGTIHAFVELVPELRLPFTRHTFTFETPERVVFSIPPLAVGVSLAAGVRFN